MLKEAREFYKNLRESRHCKHTYIPLSVYDARIKPFVFHMFPASHLQPITAYINHLPERKTGERLKNLLPSATNYINLRHTVHGLKRKKINRAKIRPITEHGTGLFRSHVTEWSVLIG